MRTWFITGAARGLGASIAERALEQGDCVVVASMRNPAQVQAALGAGERLLVVPLDVSDETQARAAVAAALRRFGRVDALINNAGYDLLGAIEEASAAEVERVFRRNVFGLLNVTRAALPQLRRQRGGRIVNVASASRGAGAGWGIQRAIKSAVEAISEALSLEGEPLGIHTTVVESGGPGGDPLSSRPLVSTVQRIEDYNVTLGPVRASAAGADQPRQEHEEALADAILSLVEAPAPPRRFRLGSEGARSLGGSKHESAVHEVEPWRSLVLPIDFVN